MRCTHVLGRRCLLLRHLHQTQVLLLLLLGLALAPAAAERLQRLQAPCGGARWC
jgi:hypothetical protein